MSGVGRTKLLLTKFRLAKVPAEDRRVSGKPGKCWRHRNRGENRETVHGALKKNSA